MAFDHSKFLIRFVEEAREHCSRICDGLLNLEKTPGDAELINSLFRSTHTIKGSSRMMKLMGVTELAHKMEDLLDLVRAGKLVLTPGLADMLLKGNDFLQGMLLEITNGNKNPEAPRDICELLERACSPEAVVGSASDTASGGVIPEAPSQVIAEPVPHTKEQPVTVGVVDNSVRPVRPDTHPQTADAGQQAVHGAGQGLQHEPHSQPNVRKQADYLRVNAEKLDELIRLMGEIVSEHGHFRRDVMRLNELERQLSLYQRMVEEQLKSGGTVYGDDRLNLLASELKTVARNSISVIKNGVMMQEHLVDDLQETAMRMRMQPLSIVFDPMRRTVRELAQEMGKQVNFVIEGGETELDRKIIDRIGDSLVHLIRNAMDHGMESSSERVQAGKPPQGSITLSACYDGGCVTIALMDDGRGISIERIREKALMRQLYSQEALAGMSKSELVNLIFMPGFSTSQIITDLSGRGVGMDVVRRSVVEELKGTILVDSNEGTGSTFMLRLPLNLALFPLFRVICADKTVALPATSIVEMLTVPASELIEIVNKTAIRLREQLIPVVPLSTLLGLSQDGEKGRGELLIVVVKDGDEKLGLLVDDVTSRDEMVVKPLPEHLQNLKLVSGVTVGERGGIMNLLHVPELIRIAQGISGAGRKPARVEREHTASILVVDDSYNTREIEKSILEAHGYQVDLGVDGMDGYEKCQQKQYDLIVTDVEMPNLDGFSLTERLRSDAKYGMTPVIIVTSREKPEDKRRGIQVGANAYIVKGAFDQNNLLDTVRSLLGQGV